MEDYRFEFVFSDGTEATICCNNLISDLEVGLDYYWDEAWAQDTDENVLDLSPEHEEEMLNAAAEAIDDYRSQGVDYYD